MQGSRGKQKLFALIGIVFCLNLLVLSFPRLMAALYLLNPAQVSQQPEKLANLARLQKLLQTNERIEHSLSWYETAENWQLLVINKIRQMPMLDVVAQDLALQYIDAANRQSLALSPVNPYAWFRLALVGNIRKDPAKKVIDAVRLSCYAERVQPLLLLKRIKLLYPYQAQLDDEMKAVLYDQIYLASQYRLWDLIVLIKQSAGLLPLVEIALQYDADRWNRILKRL
jgi:hypothetical protein